MKTWIVALILFSPWAHAAHIDAIAATKAEILVVASRDKEGAPESFLSAYDVKSGKIVRTTRLSLDSRVTGLAVLSDGNLFVVHQELTVPPSVAGFSVFDAKTGLEKAKGLTDCESYKSLDISGQEIAMTCMVDDPSSEDLKPQVKHFRFDQKIAIRPLKGFKPLGTKLSVAGVAAELRGDYPWSKLELSGKPAKTLQAEDFIGK